MTYNCTCGRAECFRCDRREYDARRYQVLRLLRRGVQEGAKPPRGRPPTCECGKCARCRHREIVRRLRARPAEALRAEAEWYEGLLAWSGGVMGLGAWEC